MLDQFATQLFKYLRTMDDEASTHSGYCAHAGLVDYGAYKGIDGKRYEEDGTIGLRNC